jgi:hypothetical protein
MAGMAKKTAASSSQILDFANIMNNLLLLKLSTLYAQTGFLTMTQVRVVQLCTPK